MAVDLEFWKGRRVLLTGHTGFKGSWLSLWLQSMGAEVTGFSLDVPTTPSLFELGRVDGLVVANVTGHAPHAVLDAAEFEERGRRWDVE